MRRDSLSLPPSPLRRLIAPLAASLLAAWPSLVPAADITSTWTGGSGFWNDPANWTNIPSVAAYPNNLLSTLTYAAVIESPIPACVVTLNNDVTIDSFSLSSSVVTLDHTAKTFSVNGAFNLAVGTYHLNGGKIANSTITNTAGQLLIKSGTLDHVTLATNPSFKPFPTLFVKNGLTLQDNTILLENSTVNLYGTQSISGTGQIVFDRKTGDFGNNIWTYDEASITIGPNITLRTGPLTDSVISAFPAAKISIDKKLTNYGIISAQTPNRTLAISAHPLTNNGLLQATNGATLALGGTIPGNALGQFDSTGGTIEISARIWPGTTLDNTGNTLALVGPGNTLTLNGATVTGGTITAVGGAQIFAKSDCTLDALTLGADISVANASELTITRNLILQGSTIRLNGTSSFTSVDFYGNQTLAGQGQIVFDGTSAFLNGVQAFGGTLTIGKDVLIRTGTRGGGVNGSRGGPSGAGGVFINQGTISAQTPGQNLSLYADRWTNEGLLEAKNGATLTLDSSPSIDWTNTGAISVDNATLLLKGTFTTSGLGTIKSVNGTVNIMGKLNNTGSTLTLNATTGSWNLGTGLWPGPTITGGTIATADGAQLLLPKGARGTLDGVTLATDLTLGSEYGLTIANGLVLQNATIRTTSMHGGLSFKGAQTISGPGQIILNGGSITFPDGPLTVGPDVTIRGSSGGIGYLSQTLINQGTIIAQAPGGLILWGIDWVNQGLIRVERGALLLFNASFTNSATIEVNGTMNIQSPQMDAPALYATLLEQLKATRNSPQGLWAGSTGLTCPAARDDTGQFTSLGLVLFGDGVVSPQSIVAKYTWNGDANLDGIVNADDYFLADSGYITQSKGWYNGDFNYDQIINADDYFLIDSAFIAQSAPLSVSAFTPVPEPATPSLLIAAALLASRRLSSRTSRRRPL